MNFIKTIQENKKLVELKLIVARKKAIRDNYVEPLDKENIYKHLITIYKTKHDDYVTAACELIEDGFIHSFDDLTKNFPELKDKYETFENGLKTGNLAILSCLILKTRDDETFRKDFLLDNSGKIRQSIYENGYKEQLALALTTKQKVKEKK